MKVLFTWGWAPGVTLRSNDFSWEMHIFKINSTKMYFKRSMIWLGDKDKQVYLQTA